MFGTSTNKVDGIDDGIETDPDWFEEYGLLHTLDAHVHSQLSRAYCGSRWGGYTGQSCSGFERAQVLTCIARSQGRPICIVGKHFRYCAKPTRLLLDGLIVNGCVQKSNKKWCEIRRFLAPERRIGTSTAVGCKEDHVIMQHKKPRKSRAMILYKSQERPA